MLNHTTEKRGNGNLELWATGPLDLKAQRRCGGWWNTAGLGLRGGGCLDPKPASALGSF